MKGRLPSSPLGGTINTRSCHLVSSMHFNVFQSFINKIFRDLLNHFVIACIDIPIYSPQKAEHVQHVKTILTRLQQSQFYITSTTFLGYIISHKGEMDQSTVKAVTEWPLPTTFKQLAWFCKPLQIYQLMHFAAINERLEDIEVH